MSSYTPDGFRREFMAHSAIGRQMGGGHYPKTLTPEQLEVKGGQKIKVYFGLAKGGFPVYIYPTYTTTQLLKRVKDDKLKKQYSDKEITDIFHKLEKPEDIFTQMRAHHYKITIIKLGVTPPGQFDPKLMPVYRYAFLGFDSDPFPKDDFKVDAAALNDARMLETELKGGEWEAPKEALDPMGIGLDGGKPPTLPKIDDRFKTLRELQIPEPFFSSRALHALQVPVSDDKFVQVTDETFDTVFPEAHIADPALKSKWVQFLNLHSSIANLYGGAVHFIAPEVSLNWEPNSVISVDAVNTYIRNKDTETLKRIAGILRESAEEKAAAARSHIDTVMLGVWGVSVGGAPQFDDIADTWENLLNIRAYELQQGGSRFSTNTDQSIRNIISHFRKSKAQLDSIVENVDRYRAMEGGSSNLDSITSLQETGRKLTEQLHKTVAKMGDIMRAVYEVRT